MSVSRIKVKEDKLPGGKYLVLYDYVPQGNPNPKQLSIKAEELLEVMEQEQEDWVWAQQVLPDGKKEMGYVPRKYIEKVPSGNYDNWAYGAEVTVCFYSFFSGMFVLLYGTSMKQDSSLDLGMGACGMMGASFLMLMVFFRDSLSPLVRAACMMVLSVPLAVGWPMGIFGAIVCWYGAGVEVVMWNIGDHSYKPPGWRCGEICRAMWGASFISIFFFLLWCASNFAIFMLGLWYGEKRAEDWQNEPEAYEIQTSEWSFAQATGVMICFQITCMLIFALQGFQQILIAAVDFRTETVGKKADFKKALEASFSPEAMTRVHRWIAWTMILTILLHVFGCFASYEHSGARKDFDRVFGTAPMITGGMLLIVLAVILSSVFITPANAPQLFRAIHRFGVLFIVLLLFHGKGGWGPNFWKWLLGPMLLFLLDKAFRFGLFGFESEDEPIDPALANVEPRMR